MADVVIVFDEKSLCISQEDFYSIAQYNRKNENEIFAFMQSENCFFYFLNDKLIFSVLFSIVKIEGKECYEITRIRQLLNKVPDLPKDYQQFNYEVGNIIRGIFNLLSRIIFSSSSKTNNSIYYRYYIRTVKEKTVDILSSKERINIVNFVKDLSYVFGIYPD